MNLSVHVLGRDVAVLEPVGDFKSVLTCSRADVRLSPAYDMLTTAVYVGYQHNPPGIGFMGKKTWTPGKTLQKLSPHQNSWASLGSGSFPSA